MIVVLLSVYYQPNHLFLDRIEIAYLRPSVFEAQLYKGIKELLLELEHSDYHVYITTSKNVPVYRTAYN